MTPPFPKPPFRVECIDNDDAPHLTVGREYTVRIIDKQHYYKRNVDEWYFTVVHDLGHATFYYARRFRAVDLRGAISQAHSEGAEQ